MPGDGTQARLYPGGICTGRRPTARLGFAAFDLAFERTIPTRPPRLATYRSGDRLVETTARACLLVPSVLGLECGTGAVAFEGEFDEAVEQGRVGEPRGFPEARVHRAVCEAR